MTRQCTKRATGAGELHAKREPRVVSGGYGNLWWVAVDHLWTFRRSE